MYYGHASLAAGWFELQGQPCPFGTNLAGETISCMRAHDAPTTCMYIGVLSEERVAQCL